MIGKMTNPNGQSFLSYKRSRIAEAKLLIAAQHDVGIPTWQDVEDLAEDPTEEAIRSVLSDPGIANAILWLTPEVQESEIIRRVEVPLIIERFRKQDGFFITPVAAGGLTYDQVADVVGEFIGIEDLQNWNIRKVSTDPISVGEAREIALKVLQRRIEVVNNKLAPREPLRIVLNTRREMPDTGATLTINWTRRFNGREASKQTWDQYLLPALNDVADTVQQKAPGRTLLATGLLSIPAATALGFVFMAPRRLNIAWEQYMPNGKTQIWAINKDPEESGFEANVISNVVTSDDLAVLISVNADVSHAIRSSQSTLPLFRAYLHIQHRTRTGAIEITSPGQAAHLAHLVANAARKAREDYRISGRIHLFLATPVGLAVLIGQLLNTLGQMQTYEHIPEGATGYYAPAALLSP